MINRKMPNPIALAKIFIVLVVRAGVTVSTITKDIVLVIAISVAISVVPLQFVNAAEVSHEEAQSDAISNARENLQQILTSEQYAEPIEKEEWERRSDVSTKDEENNWLIEFLEDLFDFDYGHDGDDNEFDFSVIGLLAALLKMFFIAALVAFIVWVVMRATGRSWGLKLTSKARRLSTVSEYESALLSQGWKSLPPHQQVPQVVQELVDSQAYNEAASILYRGGLRWLAKSDILYIAPATTEMQCVEQMTKINQSQTLLSTATKDYMTEVINIWIEQAYNPNSHNPNTLVTTVKTLEQLSQAWLMYLPLTKIKNTAQDNSFVNSSFSATHTSSTVAVKPDQGLNQDLDQDQNKDPVKDTEEG